MYNNFLRHPRGAFTSILVEGIGSVLWRNTQEAGRRRPAKGVNGRFIAARGFKSLFLRSFTDIKEADYSFAEKRILSD